MRHTTLAHAAVAYSMFTLLASPRSASSVRRKTSARNGPIGFALASMTMMARFH
ncbi:MAG: hypothetical protein R3D80_21820 [Paracoccaceae bacterium]